MKREFVLACVSALLAAPSAFSMGMEHDTKNQELIPPNGVEMYLDGFHNYAGQHTLHKDKQLQLRVAHYCKQLSPDLFQCIVYQGNGKDARLIGVEHVITDKEYQGLSAEEKKYWHPHDGEVDSGMLRMPGMDPEKEKATLQFLRSTWGKTWHVWQPEDKLPVGEAKLMWAVPVDAANDKTKASMEQRKTDHHF